MANTRPVANRKRAYPERQTLSEETALALREALVESRLTYRKAAAEIGISHGYLHDLTHGTRAPSKTVAKQLVSVLPVRDPHATALLGEAVEGHGKDRVWDPGPIVPGRPDALWA